MAQWNLDNSHANVEFSARHMMISTVKGSFEKVEGKLEIDETNPNSAYVEATIDAASLNTRIVDRDNHLRSADFLDVANYPTITFKSNKVDVSGENVAKVTGDLTIRNVTREVVLDVEFLGQSTSPWGQQAIGFTASTKINREDFGLTWNVALETGGVLVGKEIKIALDVEFIKVTEAQTA